MSVMVPYSEPSSGGFMDPVKKIRHMRGKYTVKEEVHRKVEISHPCRLTSSPVKVCAEFFFGI
jgi:hypothetical protein